MKKLQSKLILILTAFATVASAFAPMTVRAADIPPTTVPVGEWSVSTLARNSAEWKIESYKVDRGLAAWTELHVSSSKRRLYAFDGVKSRLLAELSASDWDNKDAGFVESVKGSYDAADGIVVWTMFDGQDREIFSFDGESVKKVSDNTYDDRHPITGNGRIAWTSQPDSQYNLMVRESNGKLTPLASWHVMNYTFSAKTLFWQGNQANQTWFSVFRNDGKMTTTVGKGDDRPMTQYFFVDGKGTAAWEYSTKRWDYDHRETFVSYLGNPALRVLERYVPPRNTRIEDMDNGNVMVNVYDWQYMRITERNALIQTNAGLGEKTLFQKEAMSKVRYMDEGYVMQREPNANIAMVLRKSTGEDFLTLEPIIKDRFDADGMTAAGARVGGGVVLYAKGQSEIAASSVEATDLDVQNGDVIWTEGSGETKILKYAGSTVLVKTTAYGAKKISGYLVKTTGSSAVYLAGSDGRRYLFPTATQFNDWYGDFRSVRTVSKATLSTMPLVGNVLLRPGKHLVKSPSSNRVYAVGEEGTIYALADAETAKSIFGKDWKSMIVVMGDSQFAEYKVGPSVASDLAYYATLAKKINR